MHPISRPVTRKDHAAKVAGLARYTADMPPGGALSVCYVRAQVPNARLAAIAYPPMSAGYFHADHRDMAPYSNYIEELTMPVYAADRVRYVGEVVAAIAGPDPETVRRLADETTVTYTDIQPAITSMDDATEAFHTIDYTKGDPAAAFAQADTTYQETLTTGLQEQAYMETQAIEVCQEGGVLTASGSMQCPFYIHSALKQVYGCDDASVRVVQHTTGGAFGGKEDYPSLIACQLAVLAIKSEKPCRIVFSRHEDMAYTTKRHPARFVYHAAMKHGRVTALDVDIMLDGGAYDSLSTYVLNRTAVSCAGAYNIEHLRIRARAMATNTPFNGAFRGFGGPQAFFAIETLMNHLAGKAGEDAVAFKRKHLVRQGDLTSTMGRFHDHVPLEGMLVQALAMSNYAAKRAEFAGDSGRHRRGIGLSLFYHGCGFSGNGEAAFINARLRLAKLPDGTVNIHCANAEMGQGVATAFSKIVARTLEIPLEQVHYITPDTAVVPDSGPTVASRSILIAGRILQRAAERLKAAWRDGEYQTAEDVYVDPPRRISFDKETFTGDAYPDHSWGINVVEVSLDTCTGQARATKAWAVYDCGTPIDLTILRGQAEGGILQGIGHAAMERMQVDSAGRILQASLTDYIIPTAADAPVMDVAFYEDPYYDGPFGARGAGELTVVGAAPAYLAAIENAAGIRASGIPLTAETILKQLAKERRP